jgi:cobalt-zinc-cadmium efflux system protein
VSGHGHTHGHSHGDASAQRGVLTVALVVTAGIAALELAGGFYANSLALLSDAAHVGMDVVALAIALIAAIQSARPANDRQTYGFARLEILAGLGNSALLLAITVAIVIEAVGRFQHPETPAGALMIAVAGIGLAANIAIALLLLRGESQSLNARAAVLHLAGDALAGVAVIAGGIVIAITGAGWIDPALSIVVSVIIVIGAWSVAREALDVLLESAPGHARIPAVRERIRSCDGVEDVHDLHVWTIGSGQFALSAHVLIGDRQVSEASAVLERVREAMHDDFDITHVTLQFECEHCSDDGALGCVQIPVSREAVSVSGSRSA